MNMDVKFVDEKNLDPAIWDYIMNKFGKVKNSSYESVIVDVGGTTMGHGDSIISSQRNILFYFNGIESSLVKENVDLVDKCKDIEVTVPLVILDSKSMRNNKWKPIYSSDRKIILMWVKPPHIVSCVNLMAVPMSKPVKSLIDFFHKQLNKMSEPIVDIDYPKVESELSSLIYNIKTKQARELRSEIDSMQYNINDYHERIVRNIADIRDKQHMIDSMKKNAHNDIDVKKTITSLLSMRNIKYITVEKSRIVIVTEPMYSKPFRYSGKKRKIYLGSFRISWGNGIPITIVNLEKHPDISCDHPHVKNGIPCWGNMLEIAKYAQNFDIEIVAQLVLGYLEHINPDGWHANGVYWEKYFRNGRVGDYD